MAYRQDFRCACKRYDSPVRVAPYQQRTERVISDLPVCASSPEWYSEKAAAIGLYAVACGIYTHLGLPPNILGSKVVTDLALNGLEGLVGASFVVEPDPLKAAELLDQRIISKRKALGLS